MRTQMVFGVLAVAAALAVPAVPANAAEAAPAPGTQREFNAKLGVCDACHEAGRSKATIPIISGQQENYLAKQLHDFRSGDRKLEIMKWMAESLTQEEMGLASAHFAKKSWPARLTNAASTPAPRGIAVCQACHAQNYLGAVQAEGVTTPRLAGQSYEYLVDSMRRFAEGERTNNADMVQIMKGISPADREAMARYLASL
jgi:cytochrome c553